MLDQPVVSCSRGRVRDDDAEALSSAKQRSTLQLLFKAARLLNERAIARVRERTGADVRVAHTTLLPHVDLEGTRATEIARRLGVSKQAAGQLIDELVAMGQLERVSDPRDARAKLVRFTTRGRRAMLEGLGVLGELEAELARELGQSRIAALHATLALLVARHDVPSTKR